MSHADALWLPFLPKLSLWPKQRAGIHIGDAAVVSYARVIGVLCKVCLSFPSPVLLDRETGQDATQWMRVVRNHIYVPFVLHKAARLQFREMPSKRSCRNMRCCLHSNKGICSILDRAIDFYPARMGEGSR